MDGADIKAMKELITDFFNTVERKIINLEKMIEQGFREEALTLALCYIDAMANFPVPPSNNRKNTFINIIYDYSDFKEPFSKISKIFLIRKGIDSTNKNKKGIHISCYEEMKTTLLEEYGRANDHRQEMNKDGLIKYLKRMNLKCDYKNLETNLDKFSYAAVLWERARSAGVHELGIEAPREPSFERNKQGEDIYYDGDILCFSKEIILSTLNNIQRNLKNKCIAIAKWPNELFYNGFFLEKE